MSGQDVSRGAILSAEMARAFSGTAENTFNAVDELRDAVREFVRAERADGISLEKIIDRVTAVLDRPRGGNGVSVRTELSDQVLDWCPEFYRLSRPTNF